MWGCYKARLCGPPQPDMQSDTLILQQTSRIPSRITVSNFAILTVFENPLSPRLRLPATCPPTTLNYPIYPSLVELPYQNPKKPTAAQLTMATKKILVLGSGMVARPCVEYLVRDPKNEITIGL